MSVMEKRWYQSRRNQFLLFTIAIIICIIYYISLNESLQSEPDLKITRRTRNKKHKQMKDAGWRNSVRKSMQINIEEALKADKGTGCQMPHLDPFAREVTQFDEHKPPITCTGQDWVKCYLTECRLVDEILRTNTDIVCYYQDVIYVSDHEHHLGPATKVLGNKTYVLNQSDHVKIKCFGRHYKRNDLNITQQYNVTDYGMLKSKWVGFSLGFRNSVERKPVPPNREDTLNVLIYGFDSTSRNGFIRKMPKSYDYLKNHMGATILNGYNIVGHATVAALLPILTGKTELELPDARRGIGTRATPDSFPFIFYKLKEDGYRTAYFEDSPWTGTFQYRLTGFRHQPTDHYLRAFYLQEYNDMIKIRRQDKCIGDTPQFKLMINITDQFLQLDGKKFCFTFIADITHNSDWITTADDPTLQFFKTLEKRNVFENTLLIVMGDHGPRFATVRKTLQGKLEERLPFMSIRLPDKLKRSRPHAQAMLEQNAETLTTPHDIHATILDVLDWSQHMNPYKVAGADFPRAMTLLEPIPRNRSCSEAGIEPHWCACAAWKNVSRDDSMFHRTAEAFIKYINGLTESMRTVCVPRKLIEIEWVMRLQLNKRMVSFEKTKDKAGFIGIFGAKPNVTRETYQVKVIVGPGHGTYEASLTYLRNEDRFLTNSRDISRTNAYGDEPSCISATHPHLNMFCYCKDHVSQQV